MVHTFTVKPAESQRTLALHNGTDHTSSPILAPRVCTRLINANHHFQVKRFFSRNQIIRKIIFGRVVQFTRFAQVVVIDAETLHLQLTGKSTTLKSLVFKYPYHVTDQHSLLVWKACTAVTGASGLLTTEAND